MSVAVFTDQELEAMWGCLDPKDVELASALYVLACANRAAYMCSYREEVAPPRIEAPRIGVETPAWAGSVGQWVQNLLYNCVSNGGNDFAPRAARNTIVKAAQEAQRRAAA